MPFFLQAKIMKFVGNMTLSASSDLETPDQCFDNQLLDIQPESQSGRIGIDGRLHVTTFPKRVIWFGGTLGLLQHMVHVRIVWGSCVVLDEDIADEPRAVSGGTSFAVKRADTA
jgi:hypothetical protein